MGKMKIFNIIIYILLVLSIVANLFLLMSFGGLALIYEDELRLNDIQWCEITNGWIGLTNDFIVDLSYYDSDYDESWLIEETDCWGEYDDIEY